MQCRKNCDLVRSFSSHHWSITCNNLVGNRNAVDVIFALNWCRQLIVEIHFEISPRLLSVFISGNALECGNIVRQLGKRNCFWQLVSLIVWSSSLRSDYDCSKWNKVEDPRGSHMIAMANMRRDFPPRSTLSWERPSLFRMRLFWFRRNHTSSQPLSCISIS